MRICNIPGCNKETKLRNLKCGMHATRWARYRSFDLPIRIKKPKTCRIHGLLSTKDIKKPNVCRLCSIKWQDNFRKNNPDKIKQYQQTLSIKRKRNRRIMYRHLLKRKYNLTLADYDRMFEEQKGLCEICNFSETVLDKHGKLRYLAVDHCHKTGKTRGLLCSRCNMSLGGYRDSIEIHESAARYLKKYQGSPLV